MPFLNFDLATKGIDLSTRFKILSRHLFAFFRHVTLKRLINFCLAEFNALTNKSYVSSYPYILKIESTNICNLQCRYCYDNRRPPHQEERPYGKMPLAAFKKLIDEVGPYLFKINLYGFGEPFLFPEILDMIAYATQKNIGVGISSNLNFENPRLPEQIVHSGLEVLIFSCHGVTHESYSKFMVKGNMDLAMKNISSVIEERTKCGLHTPFIDWQFCVTKFNQHELDQARAKAKDLGIDQIRFIKPFIPENVDEEWISELFPPNIQNIGKKERCPWIYRSAYINYDGGLLPCCKDVRQMGNDFGNVFKESFAKVWNNENYRNSRSFISNPKDERIKCSALCRNCPVTFTV